MNSNQLINNDEALRLFFNDDIYLVGDPQTLTSAKIEPLKEGISKEETQKNEPIAAEKTATLPKLEEPTANYPKASLEFKYLGKNEKSILILVNDKENPVSTPQGTELLRKLVLSINLKNADFALVNYSAYSSAKFEHFKAFFKCKTVFAFGVSNEHLGIPFQTLHQLGNFEETKIIFTHNLHDLDTDIPAKKALWGTLKNL